MINYKRMDGFRWFTVFEDFKDTPAEQELLEKWKNHYSRLGVRTRSEREKRKGGMVTVLYVHYTDDQDVWSRKLQ